MLAGAWAIGSEVEARTEVLVTTYPSKGNAVVIGPIVYQIVSPYFVVIEVLNDKFIIACKLMSKGNLPLFNRHSFRAKAI